MARNSDQLGPYSRRLQRGSLSQSVDGRSATGRFVRALEAELVEHLGGNPSIVQRLLIERLIKVRVQLDLLDSRLGTEGWTPHDARTYGGLLNAYRLTAREIGLRAQPPPPPKSIGLLADEWRASRATAARRPRGAAA
jgi:hypothetical protein